MGSNGTPRAGSCSSHSCSERGGPGRLRRGSRSIYPTPTPRRAKNHSAEVEIHLELSNVQHYDLRSDVASTRAARPSSLGTGRGEGARPRRGTSSVSAQGPRGLSSTRSRAPLHGQSPQFPPGSAELPPPHRVRPCAPGPSSARLALPAAVGLTETRGAPGRSEPGRTGARCAHDELNSGLPAGLRPGL